MHIFGIDFTSAPSGKKPITCACCELHGRLLIVQEPRALSDFAQFEAFLHHPGPWIAACDFPFGMPYELISNLNWPEPWEAYVRHIAAMGKSAFEETLTRYTESRVAGDKHHKRITDTFAASRSPMMLHRVPVAKMFFQGAPRLLASGASILPCHPTDDTRIVVEGYPALVARRWVDSSYKSDRRRTQTIEQQMVREHIVACIRSELLLHDYDILLEMSDRQAERLIEEPMGDELDALLCAIQAAWAYTQRAQKYGIPGGNALEGWIVDPSVYRPFPGM